MQMPYYLLCSSSDTGQIVVILFSYQTGRIALSITFAYENYNEARFLEYLCLYFSLEVTCSSIFQGLRIASSVTEPGVRKSNSLTLQPRKSSFIPIPFPHVLFSGSINLTPLAQEFL